MARLLLGLVALVIVLAAVSFLIHILFFGFMVLVVAAITFGLFRFSRRSARRSSWRSRV